jgi:hypothetical protein
MVVEAINAGRVVLRNAEGSQRGTRRGGGCAVAVRPGNGWSGLSCDRPTTLRTPLFADGFEQP